MLKQLVVLAILMCPMITFGQSELVKGIVRDQQSGQAIENVNISVVGQQSGGSTDAKGHFEFRVEQLPATLFFSHLNYSILQIPVNKRNRKKIEVFLQKESQLLDEVTISATPIQKLQLGDTLHVLDYVCVDNNRMVLLASPFKRQTEQYLYLTDLFGKQLHRIPAVNAGKQIKIPEELTPELMFFFQDYQGETQFLTRKQVQQLEHTNDSLSFSYPTSYPYFLKYVFPMKAMAGQSVFHQESTKTHNHTFRNGYDCYRPQLLKTVHDELGRGLFQRYVTLTVNTKETGKSVSAPIISRPDGVYIFDFFENHMEVFDSLGKSVKTIPIDFHNKTKMQLPLLYTHELNQKEFKQKLLSDQVTGKVYALFHRTGYTPTLKEIDMETGLVMKEIHIPDYPSINKIRVHNNTVFFTYEVKTYPFFNSLYRMKI